MEDNKENKDAQNNNEQQDKQPNVQQGKAAIAAEQIANPKPEEQQEKEEQQDAEKWRNEG